MTAIATTPPLYHAHYLSYATLVSYVVNPPTGCLAKVAPPQKKKKYLSKMCHVNWPSANGYKGILYFGHLFKGGGMGGQQELDILYEP